MGNFGRLKRKLFVIVMTGALVFGAPDFYGIGALPPSLTAPRALAASTQDIEAAQDETQQEIDDISRQKADAEAQAAALKDQADALEKEVDAYTSRLEEVNQKVEDAKTAIGETEESIGTLEAELAEAKALEESQYQAMKTRIAYFYESNSGKNLLTVLLECRSISDFISTLEYLDAVLSYDRDMLSSYQTLTQTIEEKKTALEEQKNELSSYQETLLTSQAEMDTLVGIKRDEASDAADAADVAALSVEEFEAQLNTLLERQRTLQSQADAAQAALARQIAEQQAAAEAAARAEAEQKAREAAAAEEARRQREAEEAAAQAALEQKRGTEEEAAAQAAAEAARAAAEAAAEQARREQQDAEKAKRDAENVSTGGFTPGTVAVTESDILLLAATVQAEADNQGDVGRLAVATVIMNRVDSPLFPNSVSGVVQQNQQFASWRSGAVSLILQRGPNENCIRAARQAAGGTRSGTWLFFMTKPAADSFGITGYQQIGDHVFFWKWGQN